LTDEAFISNKVYREYENPRKMVMHGDFAYISNYGSSIISKVYIECPHSEKTVNKWADECEGVHKPTDLEINGPYLYVVNSNNTISRISLDVEEKKHHE